MGEFLLIAFFVLCVLYSLKFSSARGYEKYSWFFYGILIISLTDAIWFEDIGFLRALSDFFVLGAAIILSFRTRIRIPAFACSLAL
ncbi:MAG TPA: hypothetical protein PLQ82_03565 [Desulfobacteraceae bacterium]|nr:hypothetical protein [Desulfobacteraceae bacterium]